MNSAPLSPAVSASRRATAASASGLLSEGDVNFTPERAAFEADFLAEETRELLAEDAELFLHQSLSTPCMNALAGAEGAWITDTEGRRALDFHGNNVHQTGFAHPAVIAAVKRQLDEMSFCTRRYTCEPAVALARRLRDLAPEGLTRVLFAPGGTTAIGMALKLARVATGRFKFISLWDSFHGASLDAVSVGGEAVFRQNIGPLLPGCEHAPPPEPHGCPFRCGSACSLACADYVGYMLAKEGDVAAVIAETVRCTPFIPPPEYWQKVRAACDRHGALLILDEIPTGLGRTGKMFACEHYGVVPDMLVLGKGLGGGVMPLAALLAREELNVAAHTALGHYTHEKNPVACAAGLAALEVLTEEKLPERAAALGETALGHMARLAGKHPVIAEIRGLGLLLGLALRTPDGAPAVETAERVMYACLRRGLNFKITMGHILTLTPALVITEEELALAFDILDAALTEVTARAFSEKSDSSSAATSPE